MGTTPTPYKYLARGGGEATLSQPVYQLVKQRLKKNYIWLNRCGQLRGLLRLSEG